MRIGLVSLQFEESATGGGGVHVKKISDRFVANGHQVTVLSLHTSKTGDAGLEQRTNLRLIRFQLDSGLANPYDGTKLEELDRIERFCNAVADWVKDHCSELDVIHLHGHHLVPGYLAKKLAPLPIRVVSTIHFLESTLGCDHHGIDQPKLDQMKQWEAMTAYADAVVIISPGMREEFQELAPDTPDDKIHLISSGVEEPSILSRDQIQARLATVPKKLRILSYARMVPNKGLAYSLAAMQPFRELNPTPVELCVAGVPDEGYLEVVQKAADQVTDIPDLTTKVTAFDRLFSMDERNQFMDQFDIYLFPTLAEPFGITVIETAARGMMVITTDADGPRYILEHGQVERYDWGFVSELGICVHRTDDPQKHFANNLATALHWTCNNWEPATKRMLNFHTEILKSYTWQAVAQQYLQLYAV